MKAMNLIEIPIGNITPSPLNPRKTFPAERVKEIADSISEHGILQNLTVRKAKKGYELVVGETRWRAAKIAKLKTVPCAVSELTDNEVLETMLTENMHRNDLNPIEEAHGIRQMADLSKKDVKEIAATLGKSPSFVSQRLKIAALPDATKKAVIEEKIPLSVALWIGRIADKQAQIEATKVLTSKQADRWEPSDAIAYIRDTFLLDLADAPFDPSDASLPRSWDGDKPGSCDKCPFNSASDKELFADLGKDARCTKPDCFKGKRDATWKLAVATAKELDQEVIPPAKAREMFYPSGELSYEAEREYADVTKPVPGQKSSILELCDGKVEVVIAQRPDGSVAKLAKKSDVAKALKEAGVIEPKGKSDAEKEQDLRSKAQKREHILLSRAIQKASPDLTLAELVVLACKPHAKGQRADFVKKINDWPKDGDAEELVEAMAVTNDNALLLVLANLEFYGTGPAMEALAEVLKIDRGAIKAQALAEVSPKVRVEKNNGDKKGNGRWRATNLRTGEVIEEPQKASKAPPTTSKAVAEPSSTAPQRKRRSQATPEPHQRRKRA